MDKNHASWVPIARTEGMSITVAGSETLVYDSASFMIHRLTSDVYAVWLLADGTRDIAAIAVEQGLTIRTVETVLRQLVTLNLVRDAGHGQTKLSRRLFVGGAVGVAAASTVIPASASSDGAPCYHGPCSNGTFIGRAVCDPGGNWFCRGAATNGDHYIWTEGACFVYTTNYFVCHNPSQEPISSNAVFDGFGLNDSSADGPGLKGIGDIDPDGNGEHDPNSEVVEQPVFVPQETGDPVVVEIVPDSN